MPDSTPKTISIRIAIDIPVDTAESTIQKLEGLVSKISNLPLQIGNSATPLIDDIEVAQGIKYAGQKAFAEMQADEKRERVETERHELEKSKYAANLKDFERKAVQSYRLFRQLRPQFDRDYDTYKAIAERFSWPTSIVQTKVAQRKREVKTYLRLLRGRAVMRLVYLGWTNKRIAAHIGIHEKTVARTFRELRKGFKL